MASITSLSAIVVTGLTAKSGIVSAVPLSWSYTTPPGQGCLSYMIPTGFEIYRGTTNSFAAASTVLIGTSPVAAYTDTSPLATAAWYFVVAIDPSGYRGVPSAGVSVAERGAKIAPMSLPRFGGGRFALPGDFAGRPLLVNVWASWCGPCIEEMPELQRFAASQGAGGVQVLGIALDDEANVRDFLGKVPVSYPIALDAPGPADAGVRLGNPRGVLPYSVLVSADGRLLKQRIGPFAHGEIDRWARP